MEQWSTQGLKPKHRSHSNSSSSLSLSPSPTPLPNINRFFPLYLKTLRLTCHLSKLFPCFYSYWWSKVIQKSVMSRNQKPFPNFSLNSWIHVQKLPVHPASFFFYLHHINADMLRLNAVSGYWRSKKRFLKLNEKKIHNWGNYTCMHIYIYICMYLC